MKKFPVISGKGNKYLVKIEKLIDAIDNSYSIIDVYIYKVERRLFSNKITTLYSKTFKSNSPEFYDYILASKNTVLAYEESYAYMLNKNDTDSKKKFEEWNGVC